MSVVGFGGYCSQACKDAKADSNKPKKKRQKRAAPDTTGTPPEKPKKKTKNLPVGSLSLFLFWFSITITRGNLDVELGKFELLSQWMDLYVVRGGIATERGTKKGQLHFQGACEIRSRPEADNGHKDVADTLKLSLRIKVGDGYRINVKFFTKSQTPSAMIGYTLKDRRQGWFNYVCKGLSLKDLAKGRHDHLSVKQSYCQGREELDKKAFMFKVYGFYSRFLLPLDLTIAQIVRYMLLSGLFMLGNSWIYAAGDRDLNLSKVEALWKLARDPEHASIRDVSAVLFGRADAYLDCGRVDSATVRGGAADPLVDDDVVPLHTTVPDLDNTADWEDVKARARAERVDPTDVELCAGHVFGEDDSVPATAIVSHRSGVPIPGIFEAASVAVPAGSDPTRVTETVRVFSPRDIDDARAAGGWESDEESNMRDEEEEVVRRAPRPALAPRAAGVELEDAASCFTPVDPCSP